MAYLLNGVPFTPDQTRRGSTRGSHRLSLPHICHRLAYYRTALGLTGPGKYDREARIGTAFHLLRLRHEAKRLPELPDWASAPPRAEARRQCLPFRLTLDEWDMAKSMWKVDRTRRFVPKDWKLVALETEAVASLGQLKTEVPGVDPREVVTSRLDSVWRTPKGLAIVDVKGEFNDWTTKSLRVFQSSDPKWKFHWQSAVNVAVAEVHFGEPIWAWYAYRISRQPPHDRSFDRIAVAPDLQDWAPRMAGLAISFEQTILQAENVSEVIPTGMINGACSAYGGCRFRKLCSAIDEEQYEERLDDFLSAEGD